MQNDCSQIVTCVAVLVQMHITILLL